MDESRKQFEAEIEHSYGEDFLVVNDDGDYANWVTADLWEFWVKSRAAIEIELPEAELVYSTATDTYGENGCLMLPVETIARVIRAAGIKVKE
ncbi:TPA: hypothetical protein ACJIWO_000208 [Enterobacter cloacae]